MNHIDYAQWGVIAGLFLVSLWQTHQLGRLTKRIEFLREDMADIEAVVTCNSRELRGKTK